MKKCFAKKRGFTLVEVIVAASIFTFVSVIGVTIFVNVVRIQNRIMLENQIYEDGRFMMERIAREIRQNNIDYEEYYRKNCRDEYAATAGTGCEELTYGESFGCYAQQFYNPGSDGSLGAKCNDGSDATPTCIINKTTLDINTGENPYTGTVGYGPLDANAVCDEDGRPNANGGASCDADSLHEQDQLFLIDPAGTTKTFMALQKVNAAPDEYSVAMLRFNGADTDADGINEDWVDVAAKTYNCAAGYDCSAFDPTDSGKHLENSLDVETQAFDGFVPLTPLRTNVTSLKFFVAPLEDPRKAFAETDPDWGILQQPHVTVVMTLQPSESELTDFAGELPTISLQSTISSRAYSEVKSYLGKDVCP